jgi:hypothetical protein
MKVMSRAGRLPTALTDVAFLVVAIAGMPLWILLLLAYGAAVVVRHLYWWARGNTTDTSRAVSAIALNRH